MGKQSSEKKVFLNSIIYSCSGLMLKCMSFFLLPLYTIYLTTEDYGINSVATSFITTMSFIFAFSLFSAVMRYYVDLKNTPDKLSRFYGSVSLFVFLSGLFFGLILTALKDVLSKYVFSGIDYYPVILICLVSVVFSCQHTIFDNILRSQQRALKCSICSMIYFCITVALNIYFVVVRKMGATGTLLSGLIGYIIYTIYFVIEMTVKKTIHFCLDWTLLKDALKYSIPIMPHNLSTQIAMLVSKVLIGGSASLASLGVYSAATQFGNIADTIQCYVDAAYGPWLYERLKAKDTVYKQAIRRTVNLLIAVIGLFFIGIALFAQDYILLFVDKNYAGAWKYVPLIVMVFAIKTIYYFYVEVLFFYKKASRKLFIATLTSSLINVCFSALFIPLYGVYGSIAADAVSMFVRVLIIVVISKKFDDVGLRVTDFATNFFIIALFVFGGLALSYLKYGNHFSIVNFCYKVFITILYIVMLFIRYRKEIVMFFRKLNNRRKNVNAQG